MSTININQFNQVAVLGQLDLGISASGIIEGIVSSNNGATAINAGDAVKLDSAVTVVGAPQFLTAVDTDATNAQSVIGYSVYQVKDSAVLTPDVIQVALMYRGPVIWLLAGGTINPGQAVEQTAVAGTVNVYGTTTSKLRGIALDPGVTGQLLRVIVVGGSVSLL